MGPKRSRRDGPGGVPFTALDEEDSIASPISRGIHFVEHIGGSQEEHHSPFDFSWRGHFRVQKGPFLDLQNHILL